MHSWSSPFSAAFSPLLQAATSPLRLCTWPPLAAIHSFIASSLASLPYLMHRENVGHGLDSAFVGEEILDHRLHVLLRVGVKQVSYVVVFRGGMTECVGHFAAICNKRSSSALLLTREGGFFKC